MEERVPLSRPVDMRKIWAGKHPGPNDCKTNCFLDCIFGFMSLGAPAASPSIGVQPGGLK